MTDDQIINAVTNADPHDLDDFRRIVRIAILTARLDEWNHVPIPTATRNRGRIQKLWDDLQRLHSPHANA